jgi:PAS domain S-box-containing protein
MAVDSLGIDRAIDNGEFFPHFQPLVNLRTGELEGFELLARWKHPERGWIPPDEFIPLAEKDGWIDRLMSRLMREGFCAMGETPGSARLSINISAIQLHDLGLPDRVRSISEECKFSIDRLTVEVTESALTHNMKRAREIVGALKEMGCKLALDDFGTGYSSLKHLQSLPFDTLKVDRSFVSSMVERRDSRKIVSAVVGLGQSLGLTTAAEGVETAEQDEMLRWLGCELGQGWFFGKPMASEKLAEAIEAIKHRPRPNIPREESGHIQGSSLDRPPSQRLAQLQAIYEGAPVGLAFLDRNMRYLSVNRRLAQMNGSPVADHLGRTVAEVIPGMFPFVEQYIRRALNGEAISGVEVTKPADGPNAGRTILLSYEPARDEAGEVVGVSVAVVDVTAMRRAQELQRESDEHFKHMLEFMPQIPWIIDAEGRALVVSRRWLDITGSTDDEWRGFAWLDSLHPEDRQSVQEAMQRSFKSGNPIDVYYRVRRSKDAPWKRLRARGSPRSGADGKILCWYGCLEILD